MTNPADYYSLSDIVMEQFNEQEKEESPLHQHEKGKMGGSNLWPCGYDQAMAWAGKPKPHLTGRRAYKGAMWVGKYDHNMIEKMIYDYFHTHPDQEVILADEIYEPFEIFKGMVVESPVDLAFLSPPGYFEANMKFRNKTAKVKFRHPEAKWLKIFDIKTVSDMGYWGKKLKELGKKYKAQMHGYMKATGLKKCSILWFNKDTADMFEYVVDWDENFWVELTTRLERFHKKAEELSVGLEPSWSPNDLIALDPDESYRCTYCAHAQVKSIEVDGKKPILELVEPCPPAAKYMFSQAKDKFQVGTKWKRGRSQVSVLDMKGGGIISINQTNLKKKNAGKEYEVYSDTVYYALGKYQELEDKP